MKPASVGLLVGGGLAGDGRGIFSGTFVEDGSLRGAARSRVSPHKLRNNRGTISATDQFHVRFVFISNDGLHTAGTELLRLRCGIFCGA